MWLWEICIYWNKCTRQAFFMLLMSFPGFNILPCATSAKCHEHKSMKIAGNEYNNRYKLKTAEIPERKTQQLHTESESTSHGWNGMKKSPFSHYFFFLILFPQLITISRKVCNHNFGWVPFCFSALRLTTKINSLFFFCRFVRSIVVWVFRFSPNHEKTILFFSFKYIFLFTQHTPTAQILVRFDVRPVL